MRNIFVHLTSLLVAGLVVATPVTAQENRLSGMTEEERAIFREEVRNYLLENPEIIREAIGVLEARRKAAEAQADAETISRMSTALLDDGYSYVAGNPDGDVTIVEFSDYRCAYCKRSHPEVRQLLESDPQLRLVVKEFPILGPDSVAAGRLALAAVELDRKMFGELNDALMGFRGDLNEAMAYRIAGQVGYDIAELKSLAQSEQVSARIARNYQLARELGLQGTPSFVIGSSVIRGYVDSDTMRASIEEARRALN